MYSKKLLPYILLFTLLFNFVAPVQAVHASGVDSVLGALTAPTTPQSDSGGVISTLLSFLFDKILGPILNIFGGDNSTSSTGSPPVKVTPLPPSGPIVDSGVLRGKVVIIDPGHGGSNPGAVGNNTRESDNNLAVGLKLRNKLVRAGAKVIMTRDTDRTVASAGSSLGEELQARVDIAEANHADIFVSVHSNSNPDPNIAGAMTFFPSGKSSKLALEVQTSLVKETQAMDKSTAPATFYVLRSTSMPSILVEMGFVSNAAEAARLQSDSYREKIAQGVFNGIAKYFQ